MSPTPTCPYRVFAHLCYPFLFRPTWETRAGNDILVHVYVTTLLYALVYMHMCVLVKLTVIHYYNWINAFHRHTLQ